MAWLTAKVIYSAFLVFFSYYIVLTLYYLFLVLVGLLETEKRSEEEIGEDYATLAASAFALPVSIIIPVKNEEDWITDSLKSILNLNYPEFEVIVVDDGSTDGTFEVLDSILKLKSVDRVFFERFHNGKIREIFDSQVYPDVHVIGKFGGYKKAGALNIGLNLARHKYVCVVDADTVLEPEALLRIMAHVEKDPENIIGISSYFGLVNGFKIKDGKILERSFSRYPFIAYQNLEYIRSFIANRIAWSRYNAMPIVAGGFGAWRRDILMELGGFSAAFSCEDLEFTFRAHEYMMKNKKKGYKIVMLPYYAGWTEGPSNIVSLLLQRNRWQRVTNETVWSYRHMILNPKYGMFGFLTLPYFLFYEVLGVFFEIISIVLVIWGWLAGMLNMKIFLAFFLLMMFSQIYLSLLSIFAFARSQRVFKSRDVAYLVLLSFLEFFWYRWIIMLSKITGTISYFSGARAFDSYKRSKPTSKAATTK